MDDAFQTSCPPKPTQELGASHRCLSKGMQQSSDKSMLAPAAPPPVAPPGAPPSTDLFQPLLIALTKCLCIVACGYFLRRSRIFTTIHVDGVSAYVARVALPALILLNVRAEKTSGNFTVADVPLPLSRARAVQMATLDLEALAESAHLVLAVILAKVVLFIMVVAATLFTSLRPTISFPSSPALLPMREEGADAEAGSRSVDDRAWMKRAGLYSIFATQSNDFALGLPLIEAIWGKRFTPVVFIVGCAQLAFLNPLAFGLLEAANLQEKEEGSGGGSQGVGDAGGGRRVARTGGAPNAGGTDNGGGARGEASCCARSRTTLIETVIETVIDEPVIDAVESPTNDTVRETRTVAGASSSHASSLSVSAWRRCGLACATAARRPGSARGFAVLRKVIRSPVVMACFAGLAVRGVLAAMDHQLPVVITDVLGALGDTFTGTALITLGLSLRMRPAVLNGKRVVALCLLISKFLLCPLLMRLFAGGLIARRGAAHPANRPFSMRFGDEPPLGVDQPGGGMMDEATAFAFVYGMLPSAPTVVVFAREYGERSSFLATLQLISLVVCVPLLITATVAIETPTGHEPTALASLVYTSAILGGLASLFFLAALVTGFAVKGRRMLSQSPLGWLPGLGVTALALCAMEALGFGLGYCVSDAGLRAFSSWALHCLRAQLAVIALLMAHQACPERSRRSRTTEGAKRLASWQLGGGVVAVAVPGVCEILEWVHAAAAAPPPPPFAPPHAPPPSRLSGGVSDGAPDVEPLYSQALSSADDLFVIRSSPGEHICGGAASTTLRDVHIFMDVCVTVVIVFALSIMLLAPAADHQGTVCPRIRTDPTNSPVPPTRDAAAVGPAGSVGSLARPAAAEATQQHREVANPSLPNRLTILSNGSFGGGLGGGGGLSDGPLLLRRADDSPPIRRRVGILPSHDSLDSLPSLSRAPSIGNALSRLDGPLLESPTLDPTPPDPASSLPALAPLSAAGLPHRRTLPGVAIDEGATFRGASEGALNGSLNQSEVRTDASLMRRPPVCMVRGMEPLSPERMPPPSLSMPPPQIGSSPSAVRFLTSARRVLQTSLLTPAERHVAHREPLLMRWRTRLCLLELYAVLSMLLSVTTVSTSLHEGVPDGLQTVVSIIDRIAIYGHALVIPALFGLTDEVAATLWSRVRTCLAALLVGDAEGEITAFPRSVSGFWG